MLCYLEHPRRETAQFHEGVWRSLPTRPDKVSETKVGEGAWKLLGGYTIVFFYAGLRGAAAAANYEPVRGDKGAAVGRKGEGMGGMVGTHWIGMDKSEPDPMSASEHLTRGSAITRWPTLT